jgi:hypothetical protein
LERPVGAIKIGRGALAGQDTLEDGYAFRNTECMRERQILRSILCEDANGARPPDGAGGRLGYPGDDADKGGFARTVAAD